MNEKIYPEATPPQTDKVAEPLATYYTTPRAQSYKSALPVHRIAGLEASEEVWQFAQKHQLFSHVETSIRLARESFRDLRGLRLTFEPDPELPNLDGIGIRVKAKGSLEDLIRQDRLFQERFLNEIPHTYHSRICLFVGGV